VKSFADRYGLLENDDLFGSKVNNWWLAIMDLRRALIAWEEAVSSGDYSKLIRILEKRETHNRSRSPGVARPSHGFRASLHPS
jgi:hypothetical protein